MKNLHFKSVIITLLIVFSGTTVFSQTPVLEITHKTKDKKSKYIKKGKKIRLQYEGEKYKGKIDSISAKSFFINGKEFEISKVGKIRIKYKGTQIAGGAITGSGLFVAGLGLTMFFSESKNDEACSAAFETVLLKVFGIIITAAGTVVSAAGTSLFFIGKTFNFNKKYNLKIIELVE